MVDMVSSVPWCYARSVLVPGNDRRLDIAVSIQHVAKNLLQTRKRRFAGNVIRGTNFLLRDQRKRLAHSFRSMVESRLECDFRIMETIGIELHLGATGAAAKEIDGPTFAHHIDGPFPGFGTANRFDCHIATTLVGRKHSHRFHRIFYLRDLYYLMRSHA